MMNKKRKIFLNFWVIFIVIILLILLFLLGLRLPKLFKSIQDKNKVETQSQYKTQYIHDTNKVNNIIGLINSLKSLKTLNQLKPQTEKNDNEYQFQIESNDNNQLVKDIAVVSLTIVVGVISCVVLAPILASVGPIAAPIALLQFK
ncbi:MAG: SAP01-like protein [Candidatus Phytoplasma asteris]|uniref:Uncharacterized protein n=2 Tax=16SrI (Aster yellows group) TaxID=3042590 RepID=Q6YQB7_ONYPE|nr:hypothetical protein ['Chrysanthemum coronarium' phytoplasma]TKA87846.1 MAG: hypothetical protein PLY_5280 [Periwinkle leaf yellowing phytoplasma]WEX19771.1 MAG: SAP01-like protein [Candidatus Phytoplasma asteris]BAD04543.1 hypothetical protein PAM_458 [Onion yellows phytoplasma OY-M]GAK74250.1 uncharacterized protein OYV_07500 ['Chrysanthemum coronarium' phytoplasma]